MLVLALIRDVNFHLLIKKKDDAGSSPLIKSDQFSSHNYERV